MENKIMNRIMAVAKRYATNVDSFVNTDGEICMYCPVKLPFNMSEEELLDVATTSCGPELWITRALGYRVGYKIPYIDWYYYRARIDH